MATVGRRERQQRNVRWQQDEDEREVPSWNEDERQIYSGLDFNAGKSSRKQSRKRLLQTISATEVLEKLNLTSLSNENLPAFQDSGHDGAGHDSLQVQVCSQGKLPTISLPTSESPATTVSKEAAQQSLQNSGEHRGEEVATKHAPCSADGLQPAFEQTPGADQNAPSPAVQRRHRDSASVEGWESSWTQDAMERDAHGSSRMAVKLVEYSPRASRDPVGPGSNWGQSLYSNLPARPATRSTPRRPPNQAVHWPRAGGGDWSLKSLRAPGVDALRHPRPPATATGSPRSARGPDKDNLKAAVATGEARGPSGWRASPVMSTAAGGQLEGTPRSSSVRAWSAGTDQARPPQDAAAVRGLPSRSGREADLVAAMHKLSERINVERARLGVLKALAARAADSHSDARARDPAGVKAGQRSAMDQLSAEEEAMKRELETAACEERLGELSRELDAKRRDLHGLRPAESGREAHRDRTAQTQHRIVRDQERLERLETARQKLQHDPTVSPRIGPISGKPTCPTAVAPPVVACGVVPASATVKGITKATLIRMMASVPLLEALWDDELEFIARGACVLRCAAGGVLVQQGSPGAALLVILEGSVGVYLDGAIAAELSAGHIVGEMSLLTGRPRCATVVARGEVRAMQIEGAEMATLLLEKRELLRRLRAVCSLRLKHNHDIRRRQSSEQAPAPDQPQPHSHLDPSALSPSAVTTATVLATLQRIVLDAEGARGSVGDGTKAALETLKPTPPREAERSLSEQTFRKDGVVWSAHPSKVSPRARRLRQGVLVAAPHPHSEGDQHAAVQLRPEDASEAATSPSSADLASPRQAHGSGLETPSPKSAGSTRPQQLLMSTADRGGEQAQLRSSPNRPGPRSGETLPTAASPQSSDTHPRGWSAVPRGKRGSPFSTPRGSSTPHKAQQGVSSPRDGPITPRAALHLDSVGSRLAKSAVPVVTLSDHLGGRPRQQPTPLRHLSSGGVESQQSCRRVEFKKRRLVITVSQQVHDDIHSPRIERARSERGLRREAREIGALEAPGGGKPFARTQSGSSVLKSHAGEHELDPDTADAVQDPASSPPTTQIRIRIASRALDGVGWSEEASESTDLPVHGMGVNGADASPEQPVPATHSAATEQAEGCMESVSGQAVEEGNQKAVQPAVSPPTNRPTGLYRKFSFMGFESWTLGKPISRSRTADGDSPRPKVTTWREDDKRGSKAPEQQGSEARLWGGWPGSQGPITHRHHVHGHSVQ